MFLTDGENTHGTYEEVLNVIAGLNSKMNNTVEILTYGLDISGSRYYQWNLAASVLACTMQPSTTWISAMHLVPNKIMSISIMLM